MQQPSVLTMKDDGLALTDVLVGLCWLFAYGFDKLFGSQIRRVAFDGRPGGERFLIEATLIYATLVLVIPVFLYLFRAGLYYMLATSGTIHERPMRMIRSKRSLRSALRVFLWVIGIAIIGYIGVTLFVGALMDALHR
jgi:hypothetical protein